MLNPVEIADLERRVAYYRLKCKSRYLIYTLCFIAVSATAFYFYFTIDVSQLIKTNSVENNRTTIPTRTTNDTPKVMSQESITSSSFSQNENILTSEDNDSIPIQTETLELRLPTILLPQKKEQKGQVTKSNEQLSIFKEEDSPTQNTTRKSSQKIDEPYYRSNEEKIDTSVLAPPSILTEDNVKSKITIETQEINSITYLKEKFEKTHNIIFALILAEENFLNKNYDECTKWALIANSIDADNEKSWLWFAKSKIMLGKKDDAVTALQAYLKKNKSNAAQSLLNQIIIGEFHE